MVESGIEMNSFVIPWVHRVTVSVGSVETLVSNEASAGSVPSKPNYCTNTCTQGFPSALVLVQMPLIQFRQLVGEPCRRA
jgi:hypothetical protein